ncbi:alpha/beta fold hydrolase, partial [Nonomuraea mesophila]
MRWVESGDVRLALFEEGDPGRPTIVLVHGYPDTHRVWDEVATLLRDRFHVVRYDVRGAGRSTAPRDRRAYGFDHLIADLGAVLDAVGKPKVHLAGHDWGSLQGWEAIAREGVRDRVASFTSLGGPGLRQTRHFTRHGRRRDVAAQRLRSWYIGAFRLPALPELAWGSVMPRVFTRTLLREGVTPRPGHPAPTLAEDGRNGLWLYRRNMTAALSSPEPDRHEPDRREPDRHEPDRHEPDRRGPGGPGPDPRGLDPRVPDVPVQVIEATRDRFVTPALTASFGGWVDGLWHRRLAAGHWAHRSRPDAVAGMIAEFADHVEGGRAGTALR